MGGGRSGLALHASFSLPVIIYKFFICVNIRFCLIAQPLDGSGNFLVILENIETSNSNGKQVSILIYICLLPHSISLNPDQIQSAQSARSLFLSFQD